MSDWKKYPASGSEEVARQRGTTGPASAPERTYTAEEVKLERAAALREAADLCVKRANYIEAAYENMEISGYKAEALRDTSEAILALADKSAPDKHDAELLTRGSKMTPEEVVLYGDKRYENGYKAATDELKAQTAAMLEKVAKGFDNLHWKLKSNQEAADCVRALIPADFAAALAEYVSKHDAPTLAILNEHLQGRKYDSVDDAVRNLLQAFISMKGNLEDEVADRVREAVLASKINLEADLTFRQFMGDWLNRLETALKNPKRRRIRV